MIDALKSVSDDSLQARLIRFSAVVLLLLFITLHEPFNLQVTQEEFDVLDNGSARLVLIGDLHHIYLYPDFFQRLVDAVNAQDPDIILIAGDSADDLGGRWELLGPLADMESRYGTYAVLGNHDYHSSNCDGDQSCADRMEQELEVLGIRVLRNEHVLLDTRGARFALVGVDDPWGGKSDYGRATEGIQDVPQVILVHNQNAVRGKGAPEDALILSGHTHCGQVRIPLITDLLLKATGFAQVTGGRSTLEGTGIYVTCGSDPGLVRFLAPPEITLIELE